MLAQDLRNRIESLIQEPLFLVDLEFSGDGKGRILRVVVDTDAGVTIEELSGLNHSVGRALDEEDRIAGHYRLEVCSPGLDRNLRHPRLLAKAKGKRVRVRWANVGDQKAQEASGVLLGSDDAGIEIEVDGAGVALDAARIQSVHYLLEW